ncbi:MAG: hypothetical protein AAF039_10185 [Bacteroidota bacterium]
MNKKEEFYIGYVDKVGGRTKKSLKRFVLFSISLLFLSAFLFAFFQQPSVNSSFDFGNPTKVSGVYHESPYPMLRVQLVKDEYKEIVLLGFGKSGANPYLDEIREEYGNLTGRAMTIEGQLIYYNGKTLLEIDDSQKISVTEKSKKPAEVKNLGNKTIEGEITDPKCYFGVMKPGYGKIHRSCAALCIAGGVPPVLVSRSETGGETYFLLTDLKGNPIHGDLLPYIGQPVQMQGSIEKVGDWQLLKIDVGQIKILNKSSTIY